MATTFTVLFRGSASLTSTTLYTTPASTTTLINSILITNANSSNQTYSLYFDDVSSAEVVQVPANDTVILDLKQVLNSGETIKGLASSADVKFHISGLEIT